MAEVIELINSAETPEGCDEETYNELKRALITLIENRDVDRITSAAPSGDAGRVTDIQVNSGVLRWTYESRGDTDANGEVNISDLTPLGLNFGASTHDGVNDIEENWIDSDLNGEINISDITPIGLNFWVNCDRYKVLTADDPAGPYTELGEVLFEDMLAGSFPPRFEFSVPGEVQAFLLVQPVDGAGQDGVVSIAVPSGGGGAQHFIEGPADAPASDYFPDLPVLVPDENEFEIDDHPEGAGLYTSRIRINLILQPDTTVAEANATLSSINARITGVVPGLGLLVLAIPDTGDFNGLHTALNALDANPNVAVAVEDVLLGGTLLHSPSNAEDPTLPRDPHPGHQDPYPWLWNLPPSQSTNLDGNWGMEAIRAPQAWNLLGYGRRGAGAPRTIVADVGFNLAHPEGEMANLALYTYDGTSVVPGLVEFYHGMHVAGTVGAEHYNNLGVAGVNPLLSWTTQESENFIGFSPREAFFNRGVPYDSRLDAFSTMISDIFSALLYWQDIKVMNLSLGYNWYIGGFTPIDSNTDSDAQDVAADQGAVFRLVAFLFDDVIFCAAAGNDSNAINGFAEEMNARWASPFCWAALDPSTAFPGSLSLGPAGNIVVIESADAVVPNPGDPPNAWQYTKSDFSNMGGHVAAPGSFVLSCIGDNMTSGGQFPVQLENYESLSGTSMATPHVTGLISYLASLDSSLTPSELVSLITSDPYTAEFIVDPDDITPASLAQPNDRMIDAFASVTGIDTVQGNTAIQTALVDVDDGTRDGNLRTAVLDDADFTWPPDPDPDDTNTPDHRRGDGIITMKDFRAFRDAYVAAHHAEFPTGLSLDGPASHYKKDYNFDGAVNTGGATGVACNPPHPVDIPNATTLDKVAAENLYPRYDFNGDGEVGFWSATAPYRTDPATPYGTNPDDVTDPISPPGMLRDLDVLMSTGNWSQRDLISEEGTQLAYWENVSVVLADDQTPAARHWSPKLYLGLNRDFVSSLDDSFRLTPDYLHSADIHFWLDWTHLGLRYDYIDISVTSEIDGLLSPITRSARFYPTDPQKFVLTMPVWEDGITISYDTSDVFSGADSLPAQLGEDIAYGITNVLETPDIRWDIPYLMVPVREPVYWIRSFGVGEGYAQRTLFVGPFEEGQGHPLLFGQGADGEPVSEVLEVAKLPDPTPVCGFDIAIDPAVVVDDGAGNLRFYYSYDGGFTWPITRVLDNDLGEGVLPGGGVVFDGEHFVFYSKDNGTGSDSVFYVRNTTGIEFEFGAPVEVASGIAPSVSVVDGALLMACYDPGATPYLRLYEWNNGTEMFESRDLNTQAMPPDPLEFNFELFDNNGYFGICALADGELYFTGLDSEGRFNKSVGVPDLPFDYEFRDWVRPQAMRLDGKIGVYFRGNYWLSSDSSGRDWQPGSVRVDFGSGQPDLDYTRIRTQPDFYSLTFFDAATQMPAINTQPLQ